MIDKLYHQIHKNLLKGLFLALFTTLSISCGVTTKVIEEHKEIVTYKDSTILHQDTIYTKIPVEFYYDYSPLLDTLHLETSVAAADAYLDTASLMIKGGIFNKAVEIPTEYIWKERIIESTDTVYVEKMKEIPVEVIKYKTPKRLLIYFIISLIAGGLYIYSKLK